jgi:hypothetical protein
MPSRDDDRPDEERGAVMVSTTARMMERVGRGALLVMRTRHAELTVSWPRTVLIRQVMLRASLVHRLAWHHTVTLADAVGVCVV